MCLFCHSQMAYKRSVGTRQLARVMGEARAAGAKVVLVGDAEQLPAIEAGAAFRASGITG